MAKLNGDAQMQDEIYDLSDMDESDSPIGVDWGDIKVFWYGDYP